MIIFLASCAKYPPGGNAMDPPRESSDSLEIEANADVGVTSAPHGLSSENVSARCESSSEAAPVRESYADVASVHRNSVAVDDVINVSENSLPTRPLTVSFQPRYFCLRVMFLMP